MREFAFQMRTTYTARTYYLCAESREDMERLQKLVEQQARSNAQVHVDLSREVTPEVETFPVLDVLGSSPQAR